MSGKLLSVTLSLFYGLATYDAKRNITSKHETVSITRGTSEWDNFLKHLKSNGISEVKVVKAYNLKEVNEKEPVSSENRYKEVTDLEDIQDEVDFHIKAPAVPLTPEQLELKELRERLARLESSPSNAIDNVIPTQNNEALKEARERYEKIVGKKGGPAWTVDQINEKIKDFEALKEARENYKTAFGKDAEESMNLEAIEKAIKEK